jgi:hypothetical protein
MKRKFAGSKFLRPILGENILVHIKMPNYLIPFLKPCFEI